MNKPVKFPTILWLALCCNALISLHAEELPGEVDLPNEATPPSAILRAAPSLPISGLRILPRTVHLDGSQATQALIAHAESEQTLAEACTPEVRWRISDPSIVKIEGNRLIPLANGFASLIGQWISPDGKILVDSVPVVVSRVDQPVRWEFRNHVQAVLARTGCNSGACHGALAGKGGFRLSLRGYDPNGDHLNITEQDHGRRIELSEPARSLLIAKPSGAIAHKGGLRLPFDSENYRILADWISQGAIGPQADDPVLTRIEVLPERVRLAPGQSEQVLVLAHYDNGRVEDVTKWAKFASADEAVASVDEQGRVSVIGYGEGAITAWFASRIILSRITVPYPDVPSESDFQQFAPRNFIDQQVMRQLRRLNLPPSPAASDAEFLRRVYLDTIGVLPTPEESTAFLNDKDPSKRDRLIEHLLSRPEFVDYWSYKWSDLLMINGTLLRPDAVRAYYQWVRNNVEQNTPWDKMVREIITAKGESDKNGATNFFALNQDPEGMTENSCQAFLSLSIGCARCHNHPLEKWTNDQYYAMANLFSRVRAKGWGGDPRNGDGKRTLVVLDRGDLVQPGTGKPQPPAPLDAAPINPNDIGDRREYLAQWLTSPENPYFTKSIVNRVWANFFSIGLVDPVDDLRVSNPASNPELFDELSKFVIDHRYDLKSLMREILQSQTYQRSSLPLPGNASEKRFFSRYYTKRLMAEVMHDAVCQVTGVNTKFDQIEFPGADRAPTDFYPEGTRATQLYDSAVASYFLKTFGRNQRRITCECERSDEPNVVQVLHLNNGDTLNKKLSDPKSRVSTLVADPFEPTSIVEKVYLLALSRPPTDTERQKLVSELSQAVPEERRVVVEDLFWSLMTSREFLMNH